MRCWWGLVVFGGEGGNCLFELGRGGRESQRGGGGWGGGIWKGGGARGRGRMED